MIILGITGTLGAGKGTVVGYLEEKYGFAKYSAREFITEEVRKRGLAVNRDTMTKVANDLREKFGPAYIIEKLYEKASAAGKDAVIESIRTVGEIETLRAKGNFYLLAIDANPRIRYDRVRGRGSETDHVSFEKFLEDEEREMTSDDPAKQNLSACIAKADYLFNNDDGLEELKTKIDEVMAKIIN